MPTSALLPALGLVSFSISAGGQPLPASGQVLSVSIVENPDGSGEAAVTLADGDLATGRFPTTDSDLLTHGSTLVLSIGYDGAETRLFAGLITEISLTLQQGAVATLVRARQVVAPPFRPAATLGDGSTLLLSCHSADVYGFALTLPACLPEAGVAPAGQPPAGPRGTIDLPGTAAAPPGCLVYCCNVGTRFGGLAVVAEVRHTLADGYWRTQLRLG